MKIFFDTEFTGLHQNTTLISLGMVSEDGREFYAEFADYNEKQVDDWIKENVIKNLICGDDRGVLSVGNPVIVCGNSYEIKPHLMSWLSQFEDVEFWSDCLAFDWVLLNQLIATYDNGYPKLPDNVASYTPFDIVTLFHDTGIGFDVNREEFAELEHDPALKHNAAWDAKVIKACYEKLKKVPL